MGVQLLSKTNTGIISTLFLVVLLSQSQIFNFLIDTLFGRTILIFCILGISYAHKYLGLFAALLIILLLNHYDLSYFEGFDENSNGSTTTPNVKKNIRKGPDLTKPDNITSTTSGVASMPPTTETFKAKEGFNMVERENTILRGKKSNEIPVFNNSNSSGDDVEPSDKNSFGSGYTNV